MTLPRMIRPGTGTPPPAIALASDVLEEANRRFTILLVVNASLWIIAFVLHLAGGSSLEIHTLGNPLFLPVAIASAVAAVTLAAMIRNRWIRPDKVFDLGLVYLVVAAAANALATQWTGPSGQHVAWNALWVLVFCMFVPAAPRKLLPAALLAATTDPVAMALGTLRGLEVETRPVALFIDFLPSYLSALIGVLSSKVIRDLAGRVQEERRLGSYHLEKRLGRGGMGEVWEARHRMLARPAAVKLIRPEILRASPGDGSVILRRFEREAQATALLRSPHTVELYDFGVTGDGSFYYVMELLDGLDAETLVARHGPVPPARAVHFLRQVCDSLAEAHANGLVHRDVKPANVFVCRYGTKLDFVKVLDFGLVTSGTESSGDARLTREGSVGGTPAFMAPEQVLGKPLDARTDLYALGCVAYWLVTGATVFSGTNPVEVMMEHARTVPVPPSRRTEAPMPRALEEAILACLEKDPDRRPASAEALVARLGGCVDGEAWTEDEAKRWWETHRPVSSRGEPERTVPV